MELPISIMGSSRLRLGESAFKPHTSDRFTEPSGFFRIEYEAVGLPSGGYMISGLEIQVNRSCFSWSKMLAMEGVTAWILERWGLWQDLLKRSSFEEMRGSNTSKVCGGWLTL